MISVDCTMTSAHSSMDSVALSNGHNVSNGHDEDQIRKSNGMPLTEYSASISPVREKYTMSRAVPPEYLLPDGHPDVSEKVLAGLVLISNLDI